MKDKLFIDFGSLNFKSTTGDQYSDIFVCTDAHESKKIVQSIFSLGNSSPIRLVNERRVTLESFYFSDTKYIFNSFLWDCELFESSDDTIEYIIPSSVINISAPDEYSGAEGRIIFNRVNNTITLSLSLV